MAKQKFTVSFNVPEEIKMRADKLFPDGKTAEVLTALLDAYSEMENRNTEMENLKTKLENLNTELENRNTELEDGGISANIIKEISDLYGVDKENDLVAVCKDYKAKFLQLNDENHRFTEEISKLENRNTEMENHISNLNTADLWEVIKNRLSPLTVQLLETTAERLTARENRKIEPVQILTNMFLRYTIEKWNQWFYPFVLSDREIVEIAHKVNPEITSISQLKKMLH